MQRRYRPGTRKRPWILTKTWVLPAILAFSISLSVLPPEKLLCLVAAGIDGSTPSIVEYSVHTAAVLETAASSKSGEEFDQKTAAEEKNTDSLKLAMDARAQAQLLQENLYGKEEQAAISQAFAVQAEDGTQNGQTAEQAQFSQSAEQAQAGQTAAGQSANGLTVFDEITGEEGTDLFSPVQLKSYNLAEFNSFESLIGEFYVVDASTRATESLINLSSLTSYDCTISKEDPAPQILIYHSHSQEAYADSDENDPDTTIVGVGERLTELLEGYGYSVLHHEGTYDVPSRDDTYSKALPAIEDLLEEYPSIQVVIDLHRDAVAEGTKLVYTYEGKEYARFMFFNGISRTASGPIDYLYNENLGANLSFSFQAEVVAESYFPGITRGIYLKAWRYNMHLMPKYMLIELGAQTNTVEEAMNTCEILAFVLDQVLSGESE